MQVADCGHRVDRRGGGQQLPRIGDDQPHAALAMNPTSGDVRNEEHAREISAIEAPRQQLPIHTWGADGLKR